MHVEPDVTAAIRGQLDRALARRRAPWRLLPLVPLLAVLPVAPAGAMVLYSLLIGWALWDMYTWRRRAAACWPQWLDEAVPALEDSSALLARAPGSPLARLQRARLEGRIADVGRAQYDAIARRHCRPAPLPFVLSALAAAALWIAQPAGKQAPSAPMKAVPATRATATAITMKIAPPAYTGVRPYETAPRDVQVLQYSTVTWCGSAVELGDGSTPQASGGCAVWRAVESATWRPADQPRQRYTVRVTPDQPPVVTVAAPVEATQVLGPNATVQIAVGAKDDYGIARATLHMTLARGSGENIKFSDREVPLPQSADPRRRDWSKRWSLAELGMEPGDELYFFVRATDNSPEHPHVAQSPTYTLRLPGPEAETLDSSALPSMVKPESLRSQRQIIIDTEQLVADLRANPKLPAAAVRERSEGIAADQAQLRRRYGAFLGEESTLFGDDEHGHDEHGQEHGGEHGGEHGEEHGAMSAGTNMAKMFGHAHDVEDNATIFDPQTKAVLKRAIAAMWDAEKALRAIAPATALPPEYKALAAIKELQQAERVYLHRAAFEPPAIKEEKRMTGDMAGAAGTKRPQDKAIDTVPADVKALVQALSSGAPLPGGWNRTALQAAGAIAGEEGRLAAQRAVQDVADGCVPCRPALAAWLRSTLSGAPVVLQARPEADTPFARAWREAR
ncbi:hypothetical protein IP92_05840 [Pseudoduganella flava]|uniref:DUF4175 family protein n=1 Tax=Pseudoduganella flava TaxID=871742 RepID=A0A562P8L9_9BURK|nr:DUF4175 family protein [Pseudoduganella flava]QGZ40780.1 hypothetical protein GO485_18055 [Pseudoduganella flava]TWI40751.1 hypothetical protein IP92_05840 [Pseudoduganella flava]